MVLISSGMDVFLSAEKLNSSSEEQETDNTVITRPLHELLHVHPLIVHLQHHIAVDQMTVALGGAEAYDPLLYAVQTYSLLKFV